MPTMQAVTPDLLATLPRADQRRKGELYVRGLLTAAGRKTMRNLAAVTGEPAGAQSLHHFIACSTWDWTAVRAALAAHLDRRLNPRAWVVRSMLVPKTGRHSVGVDRRFVPALGETVNSQQSYGLWLASETASAPIDWELSMGRRWRPDGADGNDATGEAAAVRSVLRAAGWGIDPRPVVMDARHTAPAPLIEAFTAAGLPFLLRVDPGCTLLAAGHGRGDHRISASSADKLLAQARAQRRPVEWIDPASPGARRTSLVAPLPVYWPGLTDAAGTSTAAGLPLRLIGKWQTFERGVSQVWLTNMTDAGYGPLLRLSKLTRRVETDFEEISQDVGMQDFEGRSYAGWHRHVTLASVAHALRTSAR